MRRLNAEKPTVIQLEGVFDVPAAQRIASAIAEAPRGEILIDLTRVREFHDFGVALLARALAGRRGIAVTGLRQHHLRLLRYLGIDPGPANLGHAAELA